MGGSSVKPQDLKGNRPDSQENNRQARLDARPAGQKHRKQGLRKYGLHAIKSSSPIEATLNFTKNSDLLKIISYNIDFIGICIDNFGIAPEMNQRLIKEKIADSEHHIRTCGLDGKFTDKVAHEVITRGSIIYLELKRRGEITEIVSSNYRRLVKDFGRLKDET